MSSSGDKSSSQGKAATPSGDFMHPNYLQKDLDKIDEKSNSDLEGSQGTSRASIR